MDAASMTAAAARRTSGLTRSWRRGHVEDVIAPRRHVEIESLADQIAAIALVGDRRVHEVAQDDFTSSQVPIRHVEVTLPLRRTVVDRDQQAPAPTRPAERDKALPRRIVVPRRPGGQEP